MRKNVLFFIFLFFGLYKASAQDQLSVTKYGLYDFNGKKLFDCKFDYISRMPNGLFSVMQKDKWGVIDQVGKIILPFQYTNVRYNSIEDVIVNNGTLEGIINVRNKKEIFPFRYEYMEPFQTNYPIIAVKNGLWGAIDHTGKEVIPFTFGFIKTFNGDHTIALRQDDYKWGVIDQKGMTRIKMDYDEITPVEGDPNLFITKMLGSVGVSAIEKGDLIPHKFSEIKETNKMFILTDYEGTGLVDFYGREILPRIYHRIEPFKDNYAIVITKDYIYGAIDITGKFVLNPIYRTIKSVNSEFAVVNDGLKPTIVINPLTLKELVSADKYQYIYGFQEGYCPVNKSTGTGLIDTDLKEYTDFSFSMIYPMTEGLAVARNKNHKSCILNKQGKIISTEYDYFGDDRHYYVAPCYRNGLIKASRNNKFGVLNNQGKEIVPCQFDEITINDNGTILIGINQ